MSKVEIHINHVGNGRVIVDGTEVGHGVRGLSVSSEVGCLPTVTLDLSVIALDITADAEVVIPEGTREALEALGWTPPGGAR